MIKGNGISEGIGLGRVKIVKNNNVEITQFKIENPENEVEFFNNAFNKVVEETKKIVNTMAGESSKRMKAYLTTLEEPKIRKETIELIKNNGYNAGYATKVGFDKVEQTLKTIDSKEMQIKIADIEDIKSRVLSKIIGQDNFTNEKMEPNTVIVTENLTTSDLNKINFSKVSGIITYNGNKYSPVSTIANIYNMPIIIKDMEGKRDLKKEDLIAMNGKTGEIYVNPTSEELNYIKTKLIEIEKDILEDTKLSDVVTLDNYKVELTPSTKNIREQELVIQNSKTFKVQIVDILKNSSKLDNITLPVNSSIDELRKAKKVFNEVKKELEDANCEYNKKIKFGVNIGTPTAALIVDDLAYECDHININVEDIIQHESSKEGNDKYNPKIINLIKKSIDGAHSAGINCGIKGEIIENKEYIPLILGLGIDEMSIDSECINMVKETISKLNFKDCKELANRILESSSKNEIEKILNQFNRDNGII